jgi:hypothetical protein
MCSEQTWSEPAWAGLCKTGTGLSRPTWTRNRLKQACVKLERTWEGLCEIGTGFSRSMWNWSRLEQAYVKLEQAWIDLCEIGIGLSRPMWNGNMFEQTYAKSEQAKVGLCEIGMALSKTAWVCKRVGCLYHDAKKNKNKNTFEKYKLRNTLLCGFCILSRKLKSFSSYHVFKLPWCRLSSYRHRLRLYPYKQQAKLISVFRI